MKSIIFTLTLFVSLESFGQQLNMDSLTIHKHFFSDIGDFRIRDARTIGAIFQSSHNDGIIIQNSFPKGGLYTDPSEQTYGYRIFWTRIINETSGPLELTISFPAAIVNSPEDYLKVFLPPDTMSLDKVILYSYGATGLKSFLDTGFDKPTMLQRTIGPKDEYVFYVGAVFKDAYGIARAGFVLDGKNLFYKISGVAPQLDSTMIPSGHITFKE